MKSRVGSLWGTTGLEGQFLKHTLRQEPDYLSAAMRSDILSGVSKMLPWKQEGHVQERTKRNLDNTTISGACPTEGCASHAT
jgi:hypothetical protein